MKSYNEKKTATYFLQQNKNSETCGTKKRKETITACSIKMKGIIFTIRYCTSNLQQHFLENYKTFVPWKKKLLI